MCGCSSRGWFPAGFDPSHFREWFLLCGAGFSSCSWWFLSPCCSAAGVAVAPMRRLAAITAAPVCVRWGLLLCPWFAPLSFHLYFFLCRAMGWFWSRVACPPFKICSDFVFYGVAVQRRLEWLISGGWVLCGKLGMRRLFGGGFGGVKFGVDLRWRLCSISPKIGSSERRSAAGVWSIGRSGFSLDSRLLWLTIVRYGDRLVVERASRLMCPI
jgi:hypothetical protein